MQVKSKRQEVSRFEKSERSSSDKTGLTTGLVNVNIRASVSTEVQLPLMGSYEHVFVYG